MSKNRAQEFARQYVLLANLPEGLEVHLALAYAEGQHNGLKTAELVMEEVFAKAAEVHHA